VRHQHVEVHQRAPEELIECPIVGENARPRGPAARARARVRGARPDGDSDCRSRLEAEAIDRAVGGEDNKREFLGEALALLLPVDWPEPFGLAVIEALACGTPVIARPCGSIPEILRDGEVGFLADTVEELAASVKRLELIDRGRCRRWVAERFTATRMAEDYEVVYRGLG
jgi:glycosyltransferase involved in cell wall biosynthesis